MMSQFYFTMYTLIIFIQGQDTDGVRYHNCSLLTHSLTLTALMNFLFQMYDTVSYVYVLSEITLTSTSLAPLSPVTEKLSYLSQW